MISMASSRDVKRSAILPTDTKIINAFTNSGVAESGHGEYGRTNEKNGVDTNVLGTQNHGSSDDDLVPSIPIRLATVRWKHSGNSSLHG